MGIPNDKDLLTLLEDAQEVKLLSELNEAAPDQTTKAIVLRSKKRLGRLWNMKLQEIIEGKEREDALILDGSAEPVSSVVRFQKLFLLCSRLTTTTCEHVLGCPQSLMSGDSSFLSNIPRHVIHGARP